MAGLSSYFHSTIGRKQVIGLTGIALSLFVLTHALGNLFLFVGPEEYNMYSHKLTSNPLIYVAEAGLVLLFISHLALAIKITLHNASSREQAYAVNASGEKATGLIAKHMWRQGIILFIFTVYHLITFKYGPYYEITYGDLVVRDIYRLVIEVFQSPFYVVGYVFSMIFLGLHLSHGLSSSIQTLGFYHPRHTPKIKLIGVLYALLVSVVFISQPLYVFFFS